MAVASPTCPFPALVNTAPAHTNTEVSKTLRTIDSCITMAGIKRKADGPEEAQPKRTRESKAASSSNLHTESDLNKLTKAALIQLVLDLQKERDDAVVQRDNYPGPKAYDPQELDKLMKQSKEMTRKGIAKQMKVGRLSPDSSFP